MPASNNEIEFANLLLYAYGELDPKESVRIEEKLLLQEDTEDIQLLFSAILVAKDVHGFTKCKDHKKWLTDQRSVHHTNENDGSDAKISTFFKKKWAPLAMAAVVTFLVAILLWFWPSGHQNAEELYTTYYTKPPFASRLAIQDPLVSQQDSAVMESNNQIRWEQLQRNYRNDQFPLTLETLLTELKTEPKNAGELNFFAGICLLNLDKTDSANAYFEKVIADTNNRYSRQARWYKVLSLIRTNQRQEARLELQVLLADPKLRGPLYEDSQDLLKEL